MPRCEIAVNVPQQSHARAAHRCSARWQCMHPRATAAHMHMAMEGEPSAGGQVQARGKSAEMRGDCKWSEMPAMSRRQNKRNKAKQIITKQKRRPSHANHREQRRNERAEVSSKLHAQLLGTAGRRMWAGRCRQMQGDRGKAMLCLGSEAKSQESRRECKKNPLA